MKSILILLRTISCVAFIFSFYIGSAQSVSSDYNTKIDFTAYKTYAWLAPGDSVLNRPAPSKLFGGYIEKAANQELKNIGLKLVNDQPDVVFLFYTNVEEITKYSQSPTLSVGVGVAGPGYYVGGSAPVAGGKITTSTVEDGTLSFSMYDTKTTKLVWTGTANKNFKQADDIPKLIEVNTKRIFRKLPIKKQK